MNRRNRKNDIPEEKLTLDESAFPALGKTVQTTKPAWGKKFSELASEWKEKEEEEKVLEPIKKEEKEISLPRFNPVHTFVEKDETPQSEVEDTSDWTTVDRTAKKLAQLARKQKREDERLKRLDDGEEFESEHSEDETCWNDGPAAHETCWDERP